MAISLIVLSRNSESLFLVEFTTDIKLDDSLFYKKNPIRPQDSGVRWAGI